MSKPTKVDEAWVRETWRLTKAYLRAERDRRIADARREYATNIVDGVRRLAESTELTRAEFDADPIYALRPVKTALMYAAINAEEARLLWHEAGLVLAKQTHYPDLTKFQGLIRNSKARLAELQEIQTDQRKKGNVD